MKKNQFKFKLLLLISTLIFCCLFLEIILRLGIIKTSIYRKNLSDGIQHGERVKLLFIGDSFVDRRRDFYKNIVKGLKDETVEILNTAWAGVGPNRYLREMKTKGKNFKPDITFLFYYTGNDLTNVAYNMEKKNKVKDNNLIKIIKYFYTYHFLMDKYLKTKAIYINYQSIHEKEKYHDSLQKLIEENKLNPWLLELAKNKPTYIIDNLLIEGETNKEAFEIVKKNFLEINKICNEINSELYIIIFPTTFQINNSHFEFFKQLGFKLDNRTLISSIPQDSLINFCQENQIQYIDLLPIFRERSEEEFYVEYDDHFNKAGNKLTSEEILKIIKSKIK